jgi:adenosylcobinamide-GDP ribazoletransferase
VGDGRGPLKTGFESVLVALALLTIFPIRLRHEPSPQMLARSRYAYPLVALLLGALLAAWSALLARLNAPTLGAFLVLAAWVGITGALHVDGLCDLCDGLFGGHTPEDRLRILRDPHLGTFGLTGGVLLLLGKFVLLQQTLPQPRGPWIVAATVVVGRCLVLLLAVGAVYPRSEGTGKVLIEATRWREAGSFAALGLPIAVWALDDWRTGLLAVLAALAAVALLRAVCRRRLGGITGDCLGAGIELSESVFLLAAVLAGLLTSG